MKSQPILVKLIVILSFFAFSKAGAQNQKINNTVPASNVNTTAVSFKNEAATAIAQALTTLTAQPVQLAETKIQKRIRKQKDPILIPYALNKKTFSIC